MNGEKQVRNKDGVDNFPVRGSTYQVFSKRTVEKIMV